MAFDPSVTPFLVPIRLPSSYGMPSSVTIATAGGLIQGYTGAGGTLTLNTTGNLAQINAIVTTGIICVTDAGDTVVTRTIGSDGSITVTNPGGVAGNISLAVVDNTSLQQLQPMYNGSTTSPTTLLPRSKWNFIPSGSVGITITDNGNNDRTDIQISADASNWSTFTATQIVNMPLGFNAGGNIYFDEYVNMGGNYIQSVGSLQFDPFGNTPGAALTVYQGIQSGGASTNPGLALTDGTHIGQIYDSYFNPPPSSGGGVTSIAVTTPLATTGGSTPTLSITPGTSGQILTTNSGGAVVWSSGAGSGTVTSVTGSSPIVITSTPTTTPNVTLTTVPVTLGGTGATSLTANGVLIGNGTSAVTSLVSTTNGQVLTIVSGVPAWAASGSGSGVTSLASANGNIVVSGTGSGPFTGAVTLTAPTWSTITASSNVNMGTFNITNATNVSLISGSDLLVLRTIAAPVSPGAGRAALELAIGSTAAGIVYDSQFNPIGGTGSAGQVLSLVANQTSSSAQVLQWVAAGGGGSGVSSIASANSNIVVSGTGSGPYTGAVTLTAPNWSTVTATASVNMGGNNINTISSVNFNGATALAVTGSGTGSTSLQCLTVTDGTHTGNVYDAQFNPVGGAGTSGQFLQLTTAATSTTPQVLTWATVSGSGGLPGAVSGSGATINIVGGNTTVPLSTTGGQLVISGSTPTWAVGNAGSNTVIGTGGTGLGNGTTPTYTYSTIIGSGTGQRLVSGANNQIIGNSAYGVVGMTDCTLIGGGLFNSTGTLNAGLVIGNDIGLATAGDTCTNAVILGGAVNGGSALTIASLGGGNAITNIVALGNGAMPTGSNMGAIGYNVGSGATGDSSFKLGIGKNTPVGTLHLGYATGSNSEVSIFFDNNPGGTAPIPSQLPLNGMIMYVAGTAGIPSILSASCGLSGTQVLLGKVGASGSVYVNTGDMLVGSANPVTGTGAAHEVGYFDIVPISSGVAGSVWTISSSGLYAQWKSASLAASEPPEFGPNPVIPPAASSVIAFEDPGDPNDPTDFELPVDFTVGSSFRIVGFNPYGWILSTALGSGVTQKIVYNDQIVIGDNDSLSGISCDPIYGNTPSASGYLGTTVELVYAKLENDGSQIWVVIYTQGVIDLFQGA